MVSSKRGKSTRRNRQLRVQLLQEAGELLTRVAAIEESLGHSDEAVRTGKMMVTLEKRAYAITHQEVPSDAPAVEDLSPAARRGMGDLVRLLASLPAFRGVASKPAAEPGSKPAAEATGTGERRGDPQFMRDLVVTVAPEVLTDEELFIAHCAATKLWGLFLSFFQPEGVRTEDYLAELTRACPVLTGCTSQVLCDGRAFLFFDTQKEADAVADSTAGKHEPSATSYDGPVSVCVLRCGPDGVYG